MPVQALWEWCIPPKINSNISIEKFMKRLKLSLSKTTFAGKLPEGSVQLLPDYQIPGMTEIDGAGLISRDALNFVWKSYNESISEISEDSCPYTQFQGRLGEFKGVWVLDASLLGITVQCRLSQRKFKLPHRCLVECDAEQSLHWDACYDCFEINSWDKELQESRSSTRLLQVLEARLPHEKVHDLIFTEIVETSVRRLRRLAQDPDSLRREIDKRESPGRFGSDEITDTRLVNDMFRAGVSAREPVFQRRRKRLVENEFKRMAEKVSMLSYESSSFIDSSSTSLYSSGQVQCFKERIPAYGSRPHFHT